MRQYDKGPSLSGKEGSDSSSSFYNNENIEREPPPMMEKRKKDIGSLGPEARRSCHIPQEYKKEKEKKRAR